MPQPKQGKQGKPEDEGMIDLEAYAEIAAAEEAERSKQAGLEDPDALPTVDEQRLKELKEQARKSIDERLRARRKQRKLMRGGEL